VAGEVAQRQVRQGAIAIEGLVAVATGRRDLVEQRVRGQVAARCAAAHQQLHLRAHDEVRQALTVDVQAVLLQALPELGPRQAPSARERLDDQVVGAPDLRRVDAELLVAPRGDDPDARRRQPHDRADVARQDEVPRGPQDVRAQDPAGRDRHLHVRLGRGLPSPASRAHAQRPARQRVLLRLDRAQPAHDLLRRTQPPAARREALIAQPEPRDLVEIHGHGRW
jgi:hypothetical protein